MTTYSVLLLYPDYMTGGDVHTYYEAADTLTPAEAIATVRRACMAANIDDEGASLIEEPEDLAVLLVIEGDHPDCNPE